MPFVAPSVLALGWICTFFADASAPAQTTPQAIASIHAVEGAADATTAILEGLDRTKRLTWAPGLSYVGVALDEVVATFRVEGTPAARTASVAVFEKLASTSPALLRPPIVVLTAGGADYRGVVESLSYQCNNLRCEVKVALLQGDTASARVPDEGWEWGPRN